MPCVSWRRPWRTTGSSPMSCSASLAAGYSSPHGLAYALDCKNIHLVNVEFYTGVGTTLEMPVMLAPVPNAIDFSDKKVLIADDVADTGKTLKLVRDFCIDHVAEVRSAVIYEKPHSLVKCEYVWKKTDRWINFPWSVDKPVVRRSGQVLDA